MAQYEESMPDAISSATPPAHSPEFQRELDGWNTATENRTEPIEPIQESSDEPSQPIARSKPFILAVELKSRQSLPAWQLGGWNTAIENRTEVMQTPAERAHEWFMSEDEPSQPTVGLESKPGQQHVFINPIGIHLVSPMADSNDDDEKKARERAEKPRA